MVQKFLLEIPSNLSNRGYICRGTTGDYANVSYQGNREKIKIIFSQSCQKLSAFFADYFSRMGIKYENNFSYQGETYVTCDINNGHSIMKAKVFIMSIPRELWNEYLGFIKDVSNKIN